MDLLWALNIAHNPHRDPKHMRDLFDHLLEDEDKDRPPPELDKTAFDLVRAQLSGNNQTKFVIK